jgi:ferrous iron transport protein A
MTAERNVSQENSTGANAEAEDRGQAAMIGNAMPLPLLPPGQTACVERVLAAGQGMVRKLSAMGIVRGVRLTVLNAQPGPLLVRVGEGRYAIGRGMAQRILVVPCQ